MALSRPESNGFATVSALVLSAAVALVVAASMAVAAAELGAARREAYRSDVEALLDAAHLQAAYEVAATSNTNRLHWPMDVLGRRVMILAENEASKISFSAPAEGWPESLFVRLGIDSARAGPLLAEAGAARDRNAVFNAPFGETWRQCALSVFSPVGQAAVLDYQEPGRPGNDQPDWRTGQVWRIRARAANGWTDDRLVRWSGDGQAPAFVIERRFYRFQGDEVSCASVLS